MKRNALIFSVGSIVYPLLEVMWRGYSHYSMAIAGGLSLMLIDIVCIRKLFKAHLIIKSLLSSVLITVVEFVTGYIVNIVLGLNVWDYSAMPLNILGQVCLPFSILWMLISIPAMWLCKTIDTLTKKYGLIPKGPARISFPDPGQ